MSETTGERIAPLTSEQWLRITQVHELVRHEGDEHCEAAFDDLIAAVTRLTAERDEARARNLTSYCAWCGEETQHASLETQKEAMTEHTVMCPKRPEPALLDALAEAERLAYMPGDWICPTYGFTLRKRLLHAETGDVGINARDESELCPNDGATLRRMTWREHAEAGSQIVEQLVAERKELRLRVEVDVRSVLTMLHEALNGRRWDSSWTGPLTLPVSERHALWDECCAILTALRDYVAPATQEQTR